MTINTPISLNSRVHGVPLPILTTVFLLGISLLLRFIFAWSSLEHLPVTSDEASVVLQAKMIFDGQWPLLCLGQPYLFPIEAYTMAPFVEWLPRTAFGARYQALTLGFLSLFGFLLIIRTAFPRGARWPAGLLVLFPSAYLLMLTSAYSPFQYPMALTLVWLSIYLVLKSRETAHNSLLLLAGLTSGLAWSSHLFTATISAGIFALIIFGGNLRRGLKGSFLFVIGFLVGAIPYLLAIWLEPGAYHNMPTTFTLARTFSRLITSVVTETFAGSMGFNPVLFPDFKAHLGWPNGLRMVFAICYIVLLGFLVRRRLGEFYQAAKNRSWPQLNLVDLALIASFLIFGWFALHKTGNNAYRYLLPAVWCFPFLIGHAFVECRGRWKTLIGSAVIVLSLFNITTAATMIKEWRKPDQIMKYSDTPQLDTLLKELELKNITHCYASFWLAYRITFESNEKIICSLPFNERFINWPLPSYKQQVDDAPEAVYILTQTFQSRLPILSFQEHLKEEEIEYQTFKVYNNIGSFVVYHDFSDPLSQQDRTLHSSEYSIKTSSNSGALNRLDTASLAESSERDNKEEGQWLEVDFTTPQVITGITLSHSPANPIITEKIQILVQQNKNESKEWKILGNKEHFKFDRLPFYHNHPSYNNAMLERIRFIPTQVSAVRFESKGPDINGQQGFSEQELKITVKTEKNL
jgi:hypothetical protein